MNSAPPEDSGPSLKGTHVFSKAHGKEQSSSKSALWPSPQTVPQSCLSIISEFQKQPRQWLHIDWNGSTSYVTVDKHKLVRELNVPYRDLRILDPMVATPYPCALLIRPATMLINMEAIRMVVCKDYLYVLSVPSANSGAHGKFATPESAFVQDLVSHLMHQASKSGECATQVQSVVDQELPFELRALEAVLNAAYRVLEAETAVLEAHSVPLLANLTRKVTSYALEKVRAVKFSMTKLETRVTCVKSELEHILDDDQDMLNMYLGRRYDMEQAEAEYEGRAAAEAAEASTAPSAGRRDSEKSLPIFEGYGSSRTTDDSFSASMARSRFPRLSPLPSEASFDSPTHSEQQGKETDMLLPLEQESQGARRQTSDEVTEDQSDTSATATPKPNVPPDHKRGGSRLKASASASEAVMSSHLESLLARQATLEALGSWGMKKFGRRATFDASTATAAYFQQLTGAAPAQDPRDIEACEGMLEVYFMQLDNLVSRLSVATSKVANTEDLISIDLDHRRNELVALNLVVNCVMVVFAVVSAVTGAFGMNFNAWMPTSESESKTAFLLAVLFSLGVGVVMFFGIMAYAKSRRLLFIANGTAA